MNSFILSLLSLFFLIVLPCAGQSNPWINPDPTGGWGPFPPVKDCGCEDPYSDAGSVYFTFSLGRTSFERKQNFTRAAAIFDGPPGGAIGTNGPGGTVAAAPQRSFEELAAFYQQAPLTGKRDFMVWYARESISYSPTALQVDFEGDAEKIFVSVINPMGLPISISNGQDGSALMADYIIRQILTDDYFADIINLDVGYDDLPVHIKNILPTTKEGFMVRTWFAEEKGGKTDGFYGIPVTSPQRYLVFYNPTPATGPQIRLNIIDCQKTAPSVYKTRSFCHEQSGNDWLYTERTGLPADQIIRKITIQKSAPGPNYNETKTEQVATLSPAGALGALKTVSSVWKSISNGKVAWQIDGYGSSRPLETKSTFMHELNIWEMPPGYEVQKIFPDKSSKYSRIQFSGPTNENSTIWNTYNWKDIYIPPTPYDHPSQGWPSLSGLYETITTTPVSRETYWTLSGSNRYFNRTSEVWGYIPSPPTVTLTNKRWLNTPLNPVELTAVTAYHPRTAAAHLANRIWWKENEDGTAETYEYTAPDANGDYTMTIRKGAGDRNGITAGTRVVSTINKRGHTTSESTFHFDGSSDLLMESWVAGNVDFLGRVTQRIWNGESSDYDETFYDCCGISSFRSREGILTEYFKDDLKRVYKKVVTAGSSVITTETTYNGLVETVRRYSGGLNVLVSETTRHLNGEIIETKGPDENGDGIPEVTTYVHSNPTNGLGEPLGKQVAITYPDGSTEIQADYLDGRRKSVTGTAVRPVSYDYGITSELGQCSPFTVVTWPTSSSPNGEWEKRYYSTPEDVFRVEYPTQHHQPGVNDFSLITYFSQSASPGSRSQRQSFTDPDGVTISYTYDSQGRRSGFVEPIGGVGTKTTSYVYDLASDSYVGNSTRITTKVNNVTVSVRLDSGDGYDAKETVLGARTTTYRRSIGVAGDWTETTTHPDGTRSRKVYDDNFLVAVEKRDATSANSGLGNIITSTTYTADVLQRVATSVDSRTGATTYNSYTESGNLLSMTEPGSRTTSFGYDVMGRRTVVDKPDTAIIGGTSSNITHTSYYPSGKIKAVWGDQVNATFRIYDEQNRMTGLRTYRGLAHGTEPTLATSGSDQTSWLYHAGRGWLSGKRDALDKGANYTYTAAGRLKTRTWARGKHTRYDYRAGYLVATRYFTSAASDDGTNAGNDPDTGDVGRTYDVFGREQNVITASSTQRPGTRILHTYNTTNTLHKMRELQQVDPDLSFTLGASSNAITINFGTIAPSISRYVHRNVDAQLRHTGVDLRLTLSPTSTREGGNYITYDANHGRITGVSPVEGLILPFSYSYVPGSNLVAGISSLSHTVTHTWHPTQDVMTGISSARGGTVLSAHSYTVNALGQRTAVSSPTTGGVSSGTYGYNARGEVVNSTFPNSNSYLYDGMGNRTSSSGIFGAMTYTPNALNQYTAVSRAGIPFNPLYDLDGNMRWGPLEPTSSQYASLAWDGENRILDCGRTESAPIVKFVYDAYGRRLMKESSGYATYWCYDGWNPIARYGGTKHVSGAPPSLTLQQSLLWGLDLSGTFQGAGGIGGLLSVNGNLIPFYDGNGNIVQHYTYVAGQAPNLSGDGYGYDPFGNLVITGITPETFKDLTDYGFSTKPMDVETKIYYYGYRYYDPITGRWLSRDPIGEYGGINLYGFVGQNPLMLYDPLGLSFGGFMADTFLNADTIGVGSELVTGADYGTVRGWAEGALGAVTVSTNVVDAATNLVPGVGQLKAGAKKALTKGAAAIIEVCIEKGTKELLEEGLEKGGKEALEEGLEQAGKKADDIAKAGETAATKAGRQAHQDWNPGEGFEKEVKLPSGKRADAVNFEQKHVKELKPDNARAVKRGEKQVEQYRKELQEEYGGDWTCSVETYKRE